MSYRFASLSSGLLARKGAAQPAMASHSGGNPRFFNEEQPEPAMPQSAVAAAPPAAFQSPHVAAPSVKPPLAAGPAFPPAATLARAGFSFESAPPPPSAPPPARGVLVPTSPSRDGTGRRLRAAGCGLLGGARRPCRSRPPLPRLGASQAEPFRAAEDRLGATAQAQSGHYRRGAERLFPHARPERVR